MNNPTPDAGFTLSTAWRDAPVLQIDAGMNGRPVLKFHPNGTVEIGDGYTPQDASDHLIEKVLRPAYAQLVQPAMRDEIDRLRAALADRRAGQSHADAGLLEAFPLDLAEIVASLGPAEWGTTEAFDADGHAAHIKNSVEETARNFQQEGPQMMHGLYLEGTCTVVCHTGTSPNSPQIARALTGAWNRLVEEARAAIAAAKGA